MRTVPGSGAILFPIFDGDKYSVSKIEVIDGGAGYASTDPPKIEIENTTTPTIEGVFYPIIDHPSNGSIVSVLIVNPGEGYFPVTNTLGEKIGIGTTSLVEPQFVTKEYGAGIIMGVSGGIGSAIFENGYNVAISTTITGVSTLIPNALSRIYGFGNPIPSTTNGIGTDAKFEVWITYDGTPAGNPISTSIILKDGGRGYRVADTVSIAGTYLGGENPTHTLSFNVSKVSSTAIVSAANASYTGVAGTTIVGVGSGATFNISRDSTGKISSVTVANGGRNYSIGVVGVGTTSTSSTPTDIISIAGTHIGGSTPADNLFVSPTLLGTDILPDILYIDKLNDDQFKVSGLSTASELDISQLGVGTHSFAFDNPNASSLIAIDNIIQTPLYRKNLTFSLSSGVGLGNTIYVTSGISSLTSLDVLKIDSEYMNVRAVGIGSTNDIIVERGQYGSEIRAHTSSSTIKVYRGDYNIEKGKIYFSTPPYGKIGQEGLKVSSNFQGRYFSRRFDPGNTTDKNLVIDDISLDFTGKAENLGIRTGTLNYDSQDSISGIDTTSLEIGDTLNLEYSTPFLINLNTVINSIGIGSIGISPNHNVYVGIATTTFNIRRLNFSLKTDNEIISGIYTNTNSSTDINNNPIILINNIPQVAEKDFKIDTPGNNTIKFISGVPNAGRIVRVAITTGFGYQPLVGASATVSVSSAGTISSISLTGAGSGYRTAPVISIASTVGSGATITATIGTGGTVTSLSIVNAGTGYTTNILPQINIPIPPNYSDLSTTYAGISTGSGEGAKVSVIVGNGSSVTGFTLEDPGSGYKVGEILVVPGITTNPTVGAGFSEFRITIEETFTDKFGGFYPGQFIKFDDPSKYFTGTKRKFDLLIDKESISLKTSPLSDLKVENNFFVFINDIIQVPNLSYKIVGSRIIFTEAPKKDSKCLILFYRGSDLDVDQVDPPKTLKEGDIIQIQQNKFELTQREQFERVIKKIISSDQFDTFTYDSLGINTDPKKSRPLKWTKQTKDRIINGVLYSKQRPDLKSRVTPKTQIIKSVSKTDTKIYVNNAFPLFSIDENLNLKEELRDVVLISNKDFTISTGTAVVSAASTISGVSITSGGSGYEPSSQPDISISSAFIVKKDPIYNWQKTTGINTSFSFNSVIYGNKFVAIGSSSLLGISEDGKLWTTSNVGFGTTVSFNSISFASTSNTYVAVGNTGKIIKSVGLSSWTEYNLVQRIFSDSSNVDLNDEIETEKSLFNGEFNDISYSSTKDTFVAVGSTYIFSSVGTASTQFIKNNFNTENNLNSISNNNSLFVTVGDNGRISYSITENVWKSITKFTNENLNKVIWDGSKFIVVGNNSTIATSETGINWSLIQNLNISTNIKNIKYFDGIYVILDTNGDLYYSLNLSYWEKRTTNQNNPIKDIVYIPNLNSNSITIVVGVAGTVMYANPSYNRATATSTTTNDSVSSVTITNGGFGYSQTTAPPVIFESIKPNKEKIISIKAKGDFGKIVGINTIGIGQSSLEFILESENYNNSLLGIGYSSLNVFGINRSQLNVGDYFVIFDSNVITGYALTGITTSTGIIVGSSGVSTNTIDGLYRVENVISNTNTGIVTVRCDFIVVPGGVDKAISTGINTTGFYGRYTWGQIYDYQNRARENPKQFDANTRNGLIGLSTAPEVYRTRGLI
jgi:hypothetical protein